MLNDGDPPGLQPENLVRPSRVVRLGRRRGGFINGWGIFYKTKLGRREFEQHAEEADVTRPRAPDATLPTADHVPVNAGDFLTKLARQAVQAPGDIVLRPSPQSSLQPEARIQGRHPPGSYGSASCEAACEGRWGRLPGG